MQRVKTKKFGQCSQVKRTWRGRKAGVIERNGSAVQSQKVGMDDFTDTESGRKPGRGTVCKRVWREQESTTSRRQTQTDHNDYTGWRRFFNKETKTWIYQPRMFVSPLLSTCNWTWRKHTNIVYRTCFPIGQFRKRVQTMVKHFKFWSTIPAFPSGRCFKKETTAILHSIRLLSLISMSDTEKHTLSTSYSAMMQTAL